MYAAEHALNHPTRPAIIMAGSGGIVTYAEYEARANQLAHFFRSEGLQRLDLVAQFMENQPRFADVGGAAERTGLYYTCVNSHLSPDEAAYIVNDSQARILVSSYAKREVATHLPERCPRVKRFLMVDGVIDGWESYEEAMEAYPTSPVPDEQFGRFMLYSSGTTGKPKGIVAPLHEGHPSVPDPKSKFANELFGYRSDMVYLIPAPLYHSAPLVGLNTVLRLGATAVIMESFDAESFLAAVERYRVSHAQAVPTMFIRLLKLSESIRNKYDVSSLESVVHAAAPCPVPIKERMLEWLGPIVDEFYTSTEGYGFTWCSAAEWLQHKGSVGKSRIGELEIRDEAGGLCPIGTPGIVWFRGATNHIYFNDEDKTRESRDRSGDASTVGDVGYVDADGYLYLTDRASHMIISGGVNIYPQEAENLLATHPKVADVAVIGVPNGEFGEEVKAVVCVDAGVISNTDLEVELISYCRDNLAHYKCPRSVDFVDHLPRLPTGKLYKRLLKDIYWKGRTITS